MADSRLECTLELLAEFEAEGVEHPSGTLLEHLRGTYELLRSWGCREELCLGGLCHSVYGTEAFNVQTVPADARERIASVAGAEAEEIAFLFCVAERDSLYGNLERGAPYSVVDRTSSAAIVLGDVRQLSDLMTLEVANLLEQLPRLEELPAWWVEERRRIYERAVPLLPAAGVEAFRAGVPRRSPAVVMARDLTARARAKASTALRRPRSEPPA